jgi:DNA (cytosine-5)-methyltransferase 1
VSDISQTLTLPNHNAQAIAVKELNLHIIANVAKNGRENGNIYNSDGLSPTLCARDYKDPKKITEVNRFYEQAFKTKNNNKVVEGDIINAFNEVVDKSGVSPTLTTRPEGFKTAILPIVENLRIRKLTPRECYRLMGFSDQAFDLAQANQSNSTLYHQAGDSIVVNVLMAIFKELL